MKTVLVRTSGSCFIIFILTFIFYSCKKESYVTIEGKILLSNTNPVPVSNYKLYFFQSGSPGIPFPSFSSSSDASTTTDNNGNYSVRFKQGESGFLFFRGTNSSPIDMSGEAIGNFPGFYINDVPSNGGTVYLYKKINSVTLVLNAFSGRIDPGDSIFIQYYSINGPVERIKTGISVAPGTNQFVLDTITDVALSHYTYPESVYSNNVFINLKRAGLSYKEFINPVNIDPIPPGDEPSRQFLYALW